MKTLASNNDFIARFSTDGSYAVFDPDRRVADKLRGHRFGVFYAVPSHLKSPSPPPSFMANEIFQAWWHESGLSFRIKQETCGEDKSVILIYLQVAKGTSLEKLPLTYVPIYLRQASFTMLAEERGQEKGKQGLRILFCIPNGGIEVKYTNKTLLDVLEYSKLWRKHGSREVRGKDLRLEHLEDTDSEVEDQNRQNWEGQLEGSA